MLAGLDVADVFGKEPCFGDECFSGADFGDFLAGEEILAGCEVVEGKDGSVAWGVEGKEFLAFDELAAFGSKSGASLLSIEAFAFPLAGGLAEDLFEVGFGVFSLSGGFFQDRFERGVDWQRGLGREILRGGLRRCGFGILGGCFGIGEKILARLLGGVGREFSALAAVITKKSSASRSSKWAFSSSIFWRLRAISSSRAGERSWAMDCCAWMGWFSWMRSSSTKPARGVMRVARSAIGRFAGFTPLVFAGG